MSQHLRISGSSARSMSPDSCLSIFISQDPLQDPCLRIHVSDSCLSIHPNPLQDPCLRIHVSASLYLRILYKIHVFRFMSQHLRISGSSARSMSLIHVSASSYLRILCKIHVSGSISQHLYISGSSARSMSSDSCLSIFVSQDLLQDPCLGIHVSATICSSGSSARSMSPIHVLAALYLWILCKIHDSGFMSQHLYIPGSSARSMSPIHVLSSTNMDPLQDPRLKSKLAQRYSESDPTRTKSAEGCTTRKKKCSTLSASHIPASK